MLGSIKYMYVAGHKRKNRVIFLQLTRVWGMEERNRKLAHLPSKVLQRSLSIFTQITCITYFHLCYNWIIIKTVKIHVWNNHKFCVNSMTLYSQSVFLIFFISRFGYQHLKRGQGILQWYGASQNPIQVHRSRGWCCHQSGQFCRFSFQIPRCSNVHNELKLNLHVFFRSSFLSYAVFYVGFQ